MIVTSEKIDKIGPALLKAQMNIEGVKKTAENPAFRIGGKISKYANLANVLDTLKEPLNNEGLWLTHPLVIASRDNHAACQVMVVHTESGQFVSSVFELAIDKITAQGFGSAGTYAQRYALVSFFALEQEDDDGNKASSVVSKSSSVTPNSSQGTNTQVKLKSATEGHVVASRAITDAERAVLNKNLKEIGKEENNNPLTYDEYVKIGKELMEEKKGKA